MSMAAGVYPRCRRSIDCGIRREPVALIPSET